MLVVSQPSLYIRPFTSFAPHCLVISSYPKRWSTRTFVEIKELYGIKGLIKRWYVNNVQGTYILFLRNIQMMYLDIFESLMCRWWEAQNNNRFLKYSNIIKKWATSSYLHIIYVISRQLFILKLYLPIVDVTQQCSSNNVKTYSCFLCIMSSVVNFEIAQYYLYGIYIDEQWFGKLFLLDVMLYCSIILYHQF